MRMLRLRVLLAAAGCTGREPAGRVEIGERGYRSEGPYPATVLADPFDPERAQRYRK